MSRAVPPVVAGAGVAAAVVAAGGLEEPVVFVLAAISALSFGDLARRAVAEATHGASDPTAIAVSLAFAVILVAAAYDLGRGAPSALPPALGAATWIAGIGLIVAGVRLRGRAAAALGKSFVVRLSESERLVDWGPYRRLRHPNYAALLLVALGTAASFASPLALAATLGLWLPTVLVRIDREERMLLRRFASYREYARRTWRLVVGVY